MLWPRCFELWPFISEVGSTQCRKKIWLDDSVIVKVDYPNGNAVTIELQIEPGVILTGDGERPGVTCNPDAYGAHPFECNEDVGETIAFLINDGQMLDGTVDDSIAWRVLNPEILHKHDVVQP